MESAEQRVLVRAFDKAVRRKPLAFAADAVGLWELHGGEGGTETAGIGEGVEGWGVGRCCGMVALMMTGCEGTNVSVRRDTSTWRA